MIGMNELIKIIQDYRESIFVSDSIEFFIALPKKNEDRLKFLIPDEYWKSKGQNYYQYLQGQRNTISHILTANYGNSGAKSARGQIAKSLLENPEYLTMSKNRFNQFLKMLYFINYNKHVTTEEWNALSFRNGIIARI